MIYYYSIHLTFEPSFLETIREIFVDLSMTFNDPLGLA